MKPLFLWVTLMFESLTKVRPRLQEDYQLLVSRVWIRTIIINIDNIDSVDHSASEISQIRLDAPAPILNHFSKLLSPGIGKIPEVKCSSILKEGTQSIFCNPRPVPYELLSHVNSKLDELEKEGIITKTNYHPWGTPLVIMSKANGTIRLCADYKVSVNKALEPNNFSILLVNELFTKIYGSSYFYILDISNAYLHIELNNESRKIAAIFTHHGTYLVNRHFFRLATAPSIYHSVTASILNNVPGCISYFGDILVFRKVKCEKNLVKVLKQLVKVNIRLN